MTDVFSDRIPRVGAEIFFTAPLEADSREGHFRKILDALPAAIYVTDPLGRITYFNEAAVALWGHRPDIGTSEWCGSWKLFWPDGRALPHGECPMAIAIKEKRAVRGMEASLSARTARECRSSLIRHLFSTLPAPSSVR